LIREAVRCGGTALNYATVERLLRQGSGTVNGVALRDMSPEGNGRTVEVQAPVVISATGAWADDLRSQVGGRSRLRKLRGSHLIFSSSRLPLSRTVTMMHPEDGRPVFAFPWEGVVLAGTTDIDHGRQMETDPAIQPAEVEYIMASLQRVFPDLGLTTKDVQGTFSGIRSVVDTGKADPSKESREHVIWEEEGLLTVTGGKLTTFRLMAHSALRAVRARFPGQPSFDPHQRVFDPPPPEHCLASGLDPAMCLRLAGRYGADAPALLAAAQPGELSAVADCLALWAELRWAARAEGVVHLDDLLMRRVRLGLIAPQGGLSWLERIRTVVQPELSWDDARWDREASDYRHLWTRCYSLAG
jgi:glycerol-3-phosphate dehydrogenase